MANGYRDPIGEVRFDFCGKSYKASFGHATLLQVDRRLRKSFDKTTTALNASLGNFNIEALAIFIDAGTSGYEDVDGHLDGDDVIKRMDLHCKRDRQAWLKLWTTIAGAIQRVYWGDVEENEDVEKGEDSAASD